MADLLEPLAGLSVGVEVDFAREARAGPRRVTTINTTVAGSALSPRNLTDTS